MNVRILEIIRFRSFDEMFGRFRVASVFARFSSQVEKQIGDVCTCCCLCTGFS